MPGGQVARNHQIGHGLGEIQKPQRVGDGRTALAQLARGLLLRITAFLHEAADGGGLLDGVEVLTLQVFDQRGLHLLLVGHAAHDTGHRLQPRQTRGAVTALARDDAVAHTVFHH